MFASIKQNYKCIEENFNDFGFNIHHGLAGLSEFIDDTFGKLNSEANSDRLKLFYAAAKGNVQSVNSLLKRGVDVNARKSVAAGFAGALGNVFTYRTNVSCYEPSYSLTPLHFAALNGHLEVVELLIRRRASVNARDDNGIGAIHLASGSGCKEIVELLLANKADCNLRDNNGVIPLHLAAEEGHMNVTLSLIKNGALFSCKTGTFSFNEKAGFFSKIHQVDSWTPLNFAISKNRHEIVKKLLRLEITVENDYISPFHLAEKNCFLEMVKCLLSSGENVGKDKLQMIFELAVAKQCSEAMTMLNKKLGKNRC